MIIKFFTALICTSCPLYGSLVQLETSLHIMSMPHAKDIDQLQLIRTAYDNLQTAIKEINSFKPQATILKNIAEKYTAFNATLNDQTSSTWLGSVEF